MPNISTSNQNSIYKYNCELLATFDSNLTIENMRVKTITIDYDYDRFLFPLIYVSVAVTDDMVKKLKANQSTGTLIFTLQKYIENSDMPGLKINVINEECVYFISMDEAKDMEKGVDENRTDDYGYITTIGLISRKHINLRNAISGVQGIINNTSISGIITYMFKSFSMLMEPLNNNKRLNHILIPPDYGVLEMLDYLNESICTFYNTKYRVFTDFDTAYLLSSSGKPIQKKGEPTSIVKINVRKNYDERNMEGMREDLQNKMYILNISSSLTNAANVPSLSMMDGTVNTVDSDGSRSSTQLQSNGLVKNKISSMRLPNDNIGITTVMKNQLSLNKDTFTISKNKIDGSIFTMNKSYTIDTSESHKGKYNGNYLLGKKIEVYGQEGSGLAMNAILSFKN